MVAIIHKRITSKRFEFYFESTYFSLEFLRVNMPESFSTTFLLWDYEIYDYHFSVVGLRRVWLDGERSRQFMLGPNMVVYLI